MRLKYDFYKFRFLKTNNKGGVKMSTVSFDYYYGNESEQFIFYRIPKLLFTDDRFSELSQTV